MTKEYILSIPKIINSNGCWIRISSTKRLYFDYNKVTIGGVKYRLHVLTAYVFIGGFSLWNNLPFICHKCNNSGCFNPEHLYIGTNKSNMLDAVKAKTHFQASKEYCSKCGREYKIYIVKTGWGRGQKRRICKGKHNA